MYKESLIEVKSVLIDKNLSLMTARELSDKFGPAGDIYSNFMEKLKNLFKEVECEPSIELKVNYWMNTIGGIYGYKPDISLFLDHTYLVLLARLVTCLKLTNNKPDEKEIFKVINGEYFINKGITNFTDDLCLWLLNPEIERESIDLLRTFTEILSKYDYSKIDEDLFREIYEEIVERKERHKAGEYYTPEWLVELILNDTLALWEKEKGRTIPKILDPACGSGTFLYRAIRSLQRKDLPLKEIIRSVEGIDINPIATTIAKANYLIAISDLLENSIEITLPIFTKDCLKSHDLFNYGKTDKYDIIIGNPPWIVMRSMKNKEYQNFLKREVLNYHLLGSKDIHLYTQMELATLFFCKCTDIYLERGGIIAFVMPRSVLAGTIQHISFRKFKTPATRLIKIIDLEEVSPLFNMPSCVLIGSKGESTKYPVLLEKYKGELSNRNGVFSEAKAKLSVKICKYTPPNFSMEPSYYHDKFKVGASIFPRSFYFVDFITDTTQSSGLAVKTSKKIFEIVKDPWKVELKGNIESDFIYASLLAWEMFPFGYIRLRPVVVPIKENYHGYRLIPPDILQKDGYKGIAAWFKKAEKFWNERKTKKSEKRFPSLLDRLDYNGLLTNQNPSVRYAVLYNATGTNLVSCVIDKHASSYFEFNGEKVKPGGFIVDVKTWFFETENMVEAYYLCTIFNSEIISRIIKPLQPRGLFGARAIHRRPLLFPIPKFNGNDRLHVKIADFGKKCHDKISALDFTQKNNIRAQVRKILMDEIEEINKIVSVILKVEE